VECDASAWVEGDQNLVFAKEVLWPPPNEARGVCAVGFSGL
jgi:hypothetical protein